MFYLNNIDINNFRCYQKAKFLFEKTTNIIIGNNATGKTSLIEAIYMLGMCKSFKTNADNDLILKDKDYFYIKGNFVNDNKLDNIILSYTNKGKNISLNEKPYKSMSDFLGFMNVIVFSPEDLKIIKGEPRSRRKFLDINISQIDNQYLKAIINYNKILKERNEILKNFDKFKNNNELLDVYTNKLIDEAKIIINKREKFIKELNPYINQKIMSITDNNEQLKVNYLPNTIINNIERDIKNHKQNDILLKTTTCGPHRDDFSFIINDLNAGIYGSQGQQRTCALSLKLGLAEMFKKITSKVIIILDDVLGELDKNRQNELMKVVNDKSQVFITTTSLENINEELIKDSKIININGMVR